MFTKEMVDQTVAQRQKVALKNLGRLALNSLLAAVFYHWLGFELTVLIFLTLAITKDAANDK